MGAMGARANPNARSTRITTQTTTVVKSTSGTIIGILVGTTAAGTIQVQDGAGTVLAQLKASVAEGYYAMGFGCAGGITVVTGAASDITVVYE